MAYPVKEPSGNVLSRSVLYQIEPRGLGTPDCESLVSYLGRLAEAHCLAVGHLLMYVIGPVLQQNQGLKPILWLSRGASVNGVAPLARSCLDSLQILTGRPNLDCLTFLPWAGILTWPGLLRKIRAWCPRCLFAWHTQNSPLYEPLSWACSEVTMCADHQIALTVRCPHPTCQNILPAYDSFYRPGFCSECGGWLGLDSRTNVPPLSTRSVRYQMWVTSTVGQMIANANHLPETRDIVNGHLQRYLRRHTGKGNALFTVDAKTVKQWRGLSMPNLLHVCAALRRTPFELVWECVKDKRMAEEVPAGI